MADKKKATTKNTTTKKAGAVNKDKWKTTGGAGVGVDLSKVEFVNRPSK